jgi:hypothetical protein
MPGLVPGIHVLTASATAKAWMAGTSPAMTNPGAVNAPAHADMTLDSTKFVSATKIV